MKRAGYILSLMLGTALSLVRAQEPLNVSASEEEVSVAGSPSATVVDVENREPNYVPLSPQQLRDSIRRAKLLAISKNGGETVSFFDYPMQCGLPVFDTMRYPLNGFHVFDPACQHNDFRNARGSVGMPDQILEYYPARFSSFRFRTNPFASWFYTPQNTRWFQTKNPYTYLYWMTNFGTDVNLLNAMFYQNVARGLNLGIDYRGHLIRGDYINSESLEFNVRVSGNYISRDSRYRLLFAYFYNADTIGENGGLKSDADFIQDKLSNRLQIPVNLREAGNRWRENRYFVKQTYHFYANQHDSIAENNRSFGFLAHEFDLSDHKLTYRDATTSADGFYKDFLLDPARIMDTVRMMKMTNRLFYSTADMEYIPFGYRFKVAAGLRNEYVRFRNKMEFFDWVNWFPFAQVQVDFADRFVFDVYADFGLGGYTQFDFTGRVLFKYLFRDDRERTLSKRDGVAVQLGVNRFAPDFLYSYHFSNHFYWNRDWKKNLETYAMVDFAYKGWWFRAKGALLQDYSYMTAEGPAQADKAFWAAWLTAGKQLRFGRYVGLDNLLMLSYSGNQNYLHLPLFSMRESLYGVIPIKKIAEIHIGVEVQYNTSYYADAYMPDGMYYYWQNEVKTGNFMILDAFINFQVKRANIFLKGCNLLPGLTPYNYIQTPHYPLQDRCFRLGISWRFFD